MILKKWNTAILITYWLPSRSAGWIKKLSGPHMAPGSQFAPRLLEAVRGQPLCRPLLLTPRAYNYEAGGGKETVEAQTQEILEMSVLHKLWVTSVLVGGSDGRIRAHLRTSHRTHDGDLGSVFALLSHRASPSFCRYSAHIMIVVTASYLVIVQADVNNVHR